VTIWPESRRPRGNLPVEISEGGEGVMNGTNVCQSLGDRRTGGGGRGGSPEGDPSGPIEETD